MAEVEANNRRGRRRIKKAVEADEEQPIVENGDHGSVTDLLKEAYESQEAEGGKKRRKKKKQSDTQLIEAVRASLEKEQDQETLDANLYDPQEKKKRRVRRRQGEENEAFEGDEDAEESEKKPKKRVRRKPKEVAEEDQAPEDEEGQQDEEPRKARRRKKKTRAEDDQPPLEDAPGSGDAPPEEEEGRSRRRRRKKRTTEQPESEGAEGEGEGAEATEMAPMAAPAVDPMTIEDTGRVLGITVHRTDRLKTDLNIAQPMVRVHVMDSDTGKYIDKQHKDRRVVSYYEDTDKVGYIQPIMTQPCDFKKQHSTLPVWEEKLVFNENFNYVSDNPRAIIFFELLDILRPATAASQYRIASRESGFYRVAWAFLRPCGANGARNVDKKVRLQLYAAPNGVRPTEPDSCYLFDLWQLGRRSIYPSTLYVTVSGIKMAPEERMQKDLRSLFPNQPEQGSMTFQHLRDAIDPGGREERLAALAASRPEQWSRLPGQLCKVPNKLGLNLQSGSRGCSSVRFSHEGSRLACACHDGNEFPILIYEFPSGRLVCRLTGHQKMMYDLSWSRKGKFLLSGSADGTARVWSLAEQKQKKVLAHPSFVYAAQFHPRVSTVVVTASYDSAVRVWGIDADRCELLQELEGHSGFVNSLAFDSEGRKLFSGDSSGTVCVWNVFVTEQTGRPGFLRDWTVLQKIAEKEMENVIINHVQVHPSDKRLLIHTRDNTLRMMDLRVGIVMQRYHGALNYRELLRGCVSPCGSFVMTGSEDRCVYVWNAETGDQVAVYRDVGLPGAVCCVDYHPQDHSAAFAALQPHAPVLVYGFDVEVAQQDAGLFLTGLSSPRSRPTSPVVNVDSLRTMEASRHGSSRALAEQEDRLATIRSERTAADAERFRTVVAKVNSVTQLGSMSFTGGRPAESLPGSQTMGGMTGTWGSTFDRTSFQNAFASNLSFGDTARQFASQNEYMRQGTGSWRPQFAPVGKGASMPPTGRPPQLALNVSGSKATFAFHQAKKEAGKEEASDQVVAIYDYQAQRSSDLSFVRGDVITVLFRDNDNWWLGQLADGSQGYFPTNYVTGDESIFAKRSRAEEAKEAEEGQEKEANGQENEGERRVNYSALVDKMGGLHILSEPDEDGDQGKRARRKSKSRTRRSRGEDLGDSLQSGVGAGGGHSVEMSAMSSSGQAERRRRRSRAREESAA